MWGSSQDLSGLGVSAPGSLALCTLTMHLELCMRVGVRFEDLGVLGGPKKHSLAVSSSQLSCHILRKLIMTSLPGVIIPPTSPSWRCDNCSFKFV